MRFYVIYAHPADYPGHYVVRLWWVGVAGQWAEPDCTLHSDLESARAEIPPGYVNLGRDPDDDPIIAEVWI